MKVSQVDRPRNVYPCGQQELYTIVPNGWASYAEHLGRFAAKKLTYTVQKGLDAMAAMHAAEAMPDDASRESVHVLLRMKLVELASTCIIVWGDLDSYIMDGFADSEQESRRSAAGHDYYERALHEDWEGVKGLMKNGADFIAAEGAALTTGGMPMAFPGEYGAARTAFLDKYLEFTQAEELTKAMTDAKIEANNAVYRELMKMFRDGQKIFRFEPAIREQFTFERVLKLIDGGGGGTGTVSKFTTTGTITDKATGLPINKVTVTLATVDGEVSTQTGPDGKYELVLTNVTAPKAGNLSATVEGYAPESRGISIVPSESTVQNFELTVLPPPPVP